MENGRDEKADGLPNETEEWFPTKSSKQDLEEVRSGRDDFRTWILANVNETKGDKKGEQSKGLPTIQEALSNSSSYEASYNFVEPFSTINALSSAVRARSNLSQKRSHGIRRLGHGVQKFAVTFLQWLHAFKGVVDIAGSADPGLVVAVKQKVEDELTDTLEDIKEYLPSMIVYEQIYRNEVLGRKIAAVYKGVIYFSRETAKYYIANHGIKRWGRSLGGKQGFYAPNSNFKKDLLAVKNQCEVLLSVNVDKLKKLAEDQKKQLDKLLAAASHERLVKFRGYLAQSPSQDTDLKSSLASYTGILQSFTMDERVEQLSSEELLSSSKEVKSWSESNISQLLIVAGRNEPSTLERDDLSWLSPAAMGIVQQLRDNGETVVYYLCQESSWQSKELLPQEILASILYQILQKEPQVLQDDSYAFLSAQFEEKDIRMLDLDVLVDAMVQVLRLPRHSKRIYIVLDRIDRCKEESVRKVGFLMSLLKLVARTKGFYVKVLVIINKLYWQTLDKDWKALEASEFYGSDKIQLFQRDQQMHPDRW
ncbi:uncharacterized protein PAC_09389 [Phialocephala subalpina]|uniref:Uncharacterized protein n=1 Tax=Phialocephala subalpina TaxID=576137 RepID=A0A1L7X3D5_9HELO|nr:uncharacterized protein PAC_09389 [Phialocephala subalpina]